MTTWASTDIYLASGREAWLNGWRRDGSGVLIGTMWHCAGCGAERGLGCVALAPGDPLPTTEPAWPFERGDCPVCQAREHAQQEVDPLTARLEAMKRRREGAT